jgi:hypothetical protein
MPDRPLHVCRACGSVDDDLGRYIEQLEAERDEQATLAKTMARKYAHLQRTIAVQDGSSKKGKQATELCELWLNSPCVTDRMRSRVRIEPGSDRHKLGVKMLNRYPLRSDDPQALALEKAVRGLIKFPYIVKGSPFPGMRAPHGQKHERYADLQYAIRDDRHIEQCCQLADMNPEEQLNRAVLPATQVETTALRRVQRYERRRDPTPPIDKVLDALSARNLWWRAGAADSWSACCPAHDDRDPSLSIQPARVHPRRRRRVPAQQCCAVRCHSRLAALSGVQRCHQGVEREDQAGGARQPDPTGPRPSARVGWAIRHRERAGISARERYPTVRLVVRSRRPSASPLRVERSDTRSAVRASSTDGAQVSADTQ